MKNEIDKWFSDEIVRINRIINYWRNYHGRRYNIGDMINDVYIHVINNINKIENISELEAMTFNYIKDNSYWFTSSINKDYKTDKEFLTQIKSNDGSIDYINEEEVSLEDKIKLEMRINYLYDFRNTLKDIEERIYFTRWIEILQDGEKPSTRRMMKEFNIKHYQSANLSKDLLSRLNIFLLKNNYK